MSKSLTTKNISAERISSSCDRSEKNNNNNEETMTYKPNATYGSDGSIVLSIEETNKLRASLGLRPLDVSETSKQKEEIEHSEEKNQDDEVFQVQRAIQEAKWRRKERELKKLKSLGELSDEEDVEESASSWLQKLKKKEEEEEEKKRQEIRRQPRQKQSSYSSNDLKGLKVAHHIDSFSDEAVVLTLKDRSVTDNVDEEDELINVDMYESEKRKWNKKKADKSSVLYSAVDSLEKQEEEILAQYDQDDNEEMKSDYFKIGHETEEQRKKRLESVKEKLKEIEKTKSYNLDDEKKIASDFLSPDEVKKKKVVTVKKRKSQKKVTRKKESLIDNTRNSERDDNGVSDFSSRRSRNEDDNVVDTKEERDRLYAIAMEKAREKSKYLKEISDPVAFQDEELDKATIQSIEKARKLTAQRNTRGVQKILLLSSENSQLKQAMEINHEKTLVFNPTEEFCRNIKEEDNEDAGKRRRQVKIEKDPNPVEVVVKTEDLQMKDVKNEDLQMEDVKNEDLNSISVKKRENKQKNIRKWSDDMEQEEEEEEFISENREIMLGGLNLEQKVGIIEEPVVSSGIGAALAFAQQKGFINSRDISGRTKDEFVDPNTERDDVILEHRDEFGRVMTQKQAYRKLCHAFHGKKPGAKKREKELKHRVEELKRRRMPDNDTPLGAVKTLQRIQEATKQAAIPADATLASLTSSAIVLDKKKTSDDNKKRRKVEE